MSSAASSGVASSPNGFLRVRCDDCAFERLVPLFCKGCAVCASCGGRTARWLDDLGRVGGGLDVQEPARPEVERYFRVDDTPWGRVEHVCCPGSIDGAHPRWDRPPPKAGGPSASFDGPA